MSGKFRVLFLSLAVVLFSAASAFAVFTSDDIDSFVVSSSDITPTTYEGYNYYQAVYVDVWPDSEDQRLVSWEIYPSYDWLHYHIDGNQVIFSGVLPAHDARMSRARDGDNPYRDSDGINHYTVHVVAHLSCDVPQGYDADGMPLTDASGNVLTVSGKIAADADVNEEDDGTKTSGLIIDVEPASTAAGLFEALVSIDASAVESRDSTDERYSVEIKFPQMWATEFVEAEDPDTGDFLWDATRSTDLFVFTELECTAAPANSGKHYVAADSDSVSLPYWLDYDVTEVQNNVTREYADTDENPSLDYTDSPDRTPYAKTLKIFYKSGTTPDKGEKGTVRILTAPATIPPDDDPNAKSFSDLYGEEALVGWNVTYSGNGPAAPVALDKTSAAIDLFPGSNASADFTYRNAAVTASPTFSAVDGVTFSAKITPANDANTSGKITVTAAASATVKEGSYESTMTVTDVNGKTATATITVNVTIPAIALTPAEVSLRVIRGGDSAEAEFAYSGAAVSGEPAFPPAIPGLTLTPTVTPANDTKNSGKITVKVEASAEAEEGGRDIPMTVTDVNGNTAAATIKLTVSTQPGTISIDVTGDKTPGGTIIIGSAPAAYTLAIKNALGNTTWTISGTGAGMISPTSGTGNTVNFTIDPSKAARAGNYSATIQAKDGSGRDAGTYSFTWTVEEPAQPISLSYADEDTISVDVGSSADIVVNYTVQAPAANGIKFDPDISADVKLTAKATPANTTAPSGIITITAEPVTIAAKIYSTDMTVTDTNGNTDSITIYVNVSVPVIELDETRITLTRASSDKSVEWSNARPKSFSANPPLKPGYHFSVTSDDSEITFSVSPDISFTESYTGTLTITDIYGGSAKIELSLNSAPLGSLIVTPAKLAVNVDVGASKDVAFTASGNSGAVMWTVGTASAGVTVVESSMPHMTMNNTRGLFTVTGRAAGKYTVRITATDQALRMVSASLDITVNPEKGDDPVIPSDDVFAVKAETPSVTVAVNQSKDIAFTAGNNSGDVTWTFTASGAGIRVAQSSRAFATQGNTRMIYTVTGVTSGDYTVTVTAADEAGRTASADVAIKVTSEAPELPDLTLEADKSSVSVYVGASVDVALTAGGNEGRVTWSYDVSGAGITVAPAAIPHATQYNTVGLYKVTGVAPGNYTVTFTATDEAGRTASEDVEVTVNAPGTFTVSPSSRAVTVTRGGASANTEAFTASSNVGAVTWTVSGLPAGVTAVPATDVSYAAQGNTVMIYTVTATAAATAGSYTATVTARDEAGHTASASIAITVRTVPTPGQFTVSPSSLSATVTRGGASVNTASLTASNNSGDVTWTVGTLPAGVTVTPATQTGATAKFTVAATSAATAEKHSVRVTARDAAGRTATATISITVNAPSAFTISPSSQQVSVEIGKSKTVSFTASNAAGTVTWSSGTSAGATVTSGGNGSFTVTGVTAGTYTVTVTASASNGTATAAISITVSEVVPDIDHKMPLTDAIRSRVRSAIMSKLGSKITSTTEVAELPASAVGSQGISYVSTTTVNLPEISITETKIYVFGVDVANLTAGAVLSYASNAMTTSTGEYVETAETDASAIFLDDSGNEITTVPANKHVNVAAYMEAGNTYAPSITASSKADSPSGIGRSSGGCSAGLGAAVSALAAMFLISRKRS